jgi:hypothetical protein
MERAVLHDCNRCSQLPGPIGPEENPSFSKERSDWIHDKFAFCCKLVKTLSRPTDSDGCSKSRPRHVWQDVTEALFSLTVMVRT